MSQPAITVKGLSKVYRINHEQRAAMANLTFRDAIVNIFHKPIELITGHQLKKEKFWALKNVSFDVEPGEVVGIIGHNGSGKSTLLKIMSRIVDPTEGEIVMRGKVASLLEVGTGFHPELTGRENIYFNGAILGMTKKEIKSKFDEIVAFSGVEKFLDTPVKFYSSGMYVRLAFSVAAHLEPDILIVDEVLAVGDSAFQKKCLGKMKDVASEGRTVLFVSHSMESIRSLCERVILLDKGKVIATGTPPEVIDDYLNADIERSRSAYKFPAKVSKAAQLLSIKLETTEGETKNIFRMNEAWQTTLSYQIRKTLPSTLVSLEVLASDGTVVYMTADADMESVVPERSLGAYKSVVTFEKNFLTPGSYYLRYVIQSPGKEIYDSVEDVAIEIVAPSGDVRTSYFGGRYMGLIGEKKKWQTDKH